MRVNNSLLNISVGLGNQMLITILSFISRTMFINILGIEYLGVNGLFTNIFAMLSLVEAGIGSSIIYSLYKPVSENNEEKINILMTLYKKAYMIIAIIIFILGFSLFPFLGYFIKDTSVNHIHIIYFIFLLNTVAPYLYVHKNNLLHVYQKNYIVTVTYSISSILSTCFKIIILYYTKNYILFLVIDMMLTIINSIILSIIVNRRYPFIKQKIDKKLDHQTKQNIIKNIKAIVLQNTGVYLVFGTDNIIISSFVSVAAVGLYSNYNMIIEIGRNITYQIFNNLYHSVGNLVAKENAEKIYNIYKVYRLLNFWLYSLFSIALIIVLEPFIKLWIGSQFLMSNNVLLILIFIFYERGMRNAITTLKTTSGIFHEDRYAPMIQAIVNLCISIVLVKSMGIIGVFIGTLVSTVAVPFWFTPYLVYKKVFNKSLIFYYSSYFFYIGLGIVTYFITVYFCHMILPNSFIKLIWVGFVCILVPNVIYLIIFYNTNEFKYLLGVFGIILAKLKGRKMISKRLLLIKNKN